MKLNWLYMLQKSKPSLSLNCCFVLFQQETLPMDCISLFCWLCLCVSWWPRWCWYSIAWPVAKNERSTLRWAALHVCCQKPQSFLLLVNSVSPVWQQAFKISFAIRSVVVYTRIVMATVLLQSVLLILAFQCKKKSPISAANVLFRSLKTTLRMRSTLPLQQKTPRPHSLQLRCTHWLYLRFPCLDPHISSYLG